MKHRFVVLFALASFLAACPSPEEPPPLQPPPQPLPPDIVVQRSSAIAPGEVCPAGGTTIESGPDRNRDGVLQDDEVEVSKQVCNPVQPPPPPPPPPTLVRIDVEPAGSHCYSGGTAVRSGADKNGDGGLGDDEVTSTTYACSEAELFEGDVTADTWKDPAAVAALAHVRVITGDLTIATSDAVSLPALEMVGGNLEVPEHRGGGGIDLSQLAVIGGWLRIEHADLTGTLALPALTRVGSALIIENTRITALAVPKLARVSGRFTLTADDLEVLDLPTLGLVEGSLEIGAMPALIDVRSPWLYTIGGDLQLFSNPKLHTIAGLATVSSVGGGIWIYSNDTLADALFDNLVAVGPFRATGPGLVHVGAARLDSAAGSIFVGYGAKLTSIAFPALRRVRGNIDIAHAPSLGSLALPALEAITAGYPNEPSLTVERTALVALSLPALARADQGIRFKENPVMTAVQLPALTSTAAIEVLDLPKVDTLAAPVLTQIGTLHVTAPVTTFALNPQLAVSGTLAIANTSIASLPPIRLLAGAHLQLASLANLVDLRNLIFPDTLAAVELYQLPALTSITALDAVSTIAQRIEVYGTGLTSLAGLDHVSHTEWLQIEWNGALTSLDHLEAMNTVGDLILTHNAVLSSITGLDHLTRATDGADVTNNPEVPADQIAALLARLGQ